MRKPKKKDIPRYYLDNIQCPLLKAKWNLIICDDLLHALKGVDSFDEMCEQIFDGDQEATEAYINGANALTIRLVKSNHLIVILPKDVKNGVIAHEAVHLAKMIFEDRGIKECHDTEEVYAHTVDWIVEEIHALKDIMVKTERKTARENAKIQE